MLFLFSLPFSDANFAIIIKTTGAKFIIITATIENPPFGTDFHPSMEGRLPSLTPHPLQLKTKD